MFLLTMFVEISLKWLFNNTTKYIMERKNQQEYQKNITQQKRQKIH